VSSTSKPRTAVVTGGASGIGAAIARRLASDGHRVATWDITPAEGGVYYEVDVTDRAQIDAALADIHSRFGPVTILVNAAGVEGFARFLDISFAEWQRVIDVSLNGVFHTIQAVLPDMAEAGWGRIVNISSSSTHSGTPMKSHYVAAKSGVNGLTKSLALEYGPQGRHRQRRTSRLRRHPHVAQRPAPRRLRRPDAGGHRRRNPRAAHRSA
jgi:2-hydroxycyclohexanecarboxyl-CoA dehydrogenase